jgi:hypothetical protein
LPASSLHSISSVVATSSAGAAAFTVTVFRRSATAAATFAAFSGISGIASPL